MSYSDLIALPFHVNHAFYRVHGLLRIEGDALTIECQPVENIFGLMRGTVRSIDVPFAQLADVALTKGPRGGRLLCLRSYYLQTLRRFPGAHEGELLLRIRRSHAQLAEDFVNRLELELTAAQLRRLDGQAAPPLPPGAETRIEQLLKLWDGIKSLLK